MRTDTTATIARQDYEPYPYRLPDVEFNFDLDAKETRVSSLLRFECATERNQPLILNGEDLQLESIKLDGQVLSPGQFKLNQNALIIFPTTQSFTVEIVSLCKPAENLTLMGLYVSGDKLFTQCEAQGFRRITWYPDRPDVMSRFRVTLRAAKAAYPLLLSNGNLLKSDTLPDNRHIAVWYDPHPKPCYLFALVAGDFSYREQAVRTQSDRTAVLQVYSDRGSENKTQWALDSLARAVKWDEQRFGLELDLDRFMVVAARDFNMGAMENKGLNIFNSSYVLADPETATDAGYRGIEAVIGHEYFHNWTGNRVTCRDWFQLSLKEGLTVFRDQEFSADMMAMGLTKEQARSARAVKRIDDVSMLRMAQFPEDAGPMAHPIRPESYQEIGNFYTATIYEKGAEVIRMQHTLLGEKGFLAGMHEYFRRHDGSAVTCDDFVDAMESIYIRQNPEKTLDIFRRWYSQAGTPRVRVQIKHDTQSKECFITLSQRCEPAGLEKLRTPPADKPPLHIPFALGLLDNGGQALPIHYNNQVQDTILLELSTKEQTWKFPGFTQTPLPSLLRNFSAPVIVEYNYSDTELATLARHDTDPFARWEAAQELATRQLLALMNDQRKGHPLTVSPLFLDTWRSLIQDQTLTAAYRARALALPAERLLLEKTAPMDPVAVVQASKQLRRSLGIELAALWTRIYHDCLDTGTDYRPDAMSAGRRALKNLALAYLLAANHPAAQALALDQYYQAANMTDRMGSLGALVSFCDAPVSGPILHHFYEQWQHDPLVIDKWFSVQATAPTTRVDAVRNLMRHPAFTLRNPNRARSLIFQFCTNNLQGIHTTEGYEFWADQVIALDQINPEIAARLARSFDNWARYVEPVSSALESELKRIQNQTTLSRNVGEIVSKALNISIGSIQ